MCKETTVKILYEETKIFGGEIWHNLGDAQNAVQVTCRKYQDDYIIHKRIKVDGAWVVDKRKAGNPLNVTDTISMVSGVATFAPAGDLPG